MMSEPPEVQVGKTSQPTESARSGQTIVCCTDGPIVNSRSAREPIRHAPRKEIRVSRIESSDRNRVIITKETTPRYVYEKSNTTSWPLCKGRS